MPRHLKRVGGIWRYYRRVPKLFRDVDRRTFVEESLGTRDLATAEKLKAAVARKVEQRWIALKNGEAEEAEARYRGAVELARLEGFQYRSAAELAAGPLTEILRRLDRLEARGLGDSRAAEALLGGAAAAVPNFRVCAEDYIAGQEQAWRNKKHRAQWRSTLATYAYPQFGDLPVSDVDTALVLKAVEPIWPSKPETASRLRQRIEAVLDAAKTKGYRRGDNPARWKGHLENLLPARSKVRAVRNHPALPYKEIPAFMLLIRARQGESVRALELTILTAARSSELTGASWAEFDLDEAVWTIPAERMKAEEVHRVPLSAPALELLKRQRREGEAKDGYVFRGQRKPKLSESAMLECLRGLRPGLTVHGFRSTFKDWASDETDYDNIVSEMALAHTIDSKVEAAYRRGELFRKRRALMDDWARYCCGEG